MPYLTDDPIDLSALTASAVRRADGAVVSFAGLVRDHHEGRAVESIDYHAYREMAEKEIAKIVGAVESEHPDVHVGVIHRLGVVKVGEASIAIVCSAPHRADAFEACRKVIDRVKQAVPIWKKEYGPDGASWVGWQGDQIGPVPDSETEE